MDASSEPKEISFYEVGHELTAEGAVGPR